MAEEVGMGKRCGNFCSAHAMGLITVLVPLMFSPLLITHPLNEMRTLWVVLVMAIWWISEAIPLQITSLMPLFIFPIMGILDTVTVSSFYFKDTLMLFVAGIVTALGIEYSNLHKRMALNMILVVGCSPKKLHWSLCACTTFASMWISNAAATAMMCPIIKALMEELSQQGILKQYSDRLPPNPDDAKYPSRIALSFYLGVAYCSSLGGCGTLIGTGTNVTFLGLYDTRFPTAQDINFMNWMFFGVPPMICNMLLTIIWLQFMYMGLFRPNSQDASDASVTNEGIKAAELVIRQRIEELGPLRCQEVQVGLWFITMIFLLIFRKPGFCPGWAELFSIVKVKNSMPLVLTCVALFVLPVNYYFFYYFICKRPPYEKTADSVLIWEYINKNCPWGLLFLLAGGFALAAGLKASGLAVMLGNSLKFLQAYPPPVVQLLVLIVSVILTAFASNVAMCNILVPVLMEMAVAIEVHPGYLGFPSCIALSMAFHFPVSTPANAIIAGWANVQTSDMAVAGIGPSIIIIVIYFLFFQTYGRLIFPQFQTFPNWAKAEK